MVRGRRARSRTDSLLGGAAAAGPRRQRPEAEAPGAVRRAALVVALEAAALAALALVLLWLTLTSDPDSTGRALAEVVYVGVGAGLLGFNLAFAGDQPLIGVPVLVLVATELYLLLTPEARLAFYHR